MCYFFFPKLTVICLSCSNFELLLLMNFFFFPCIRGKKTSFLNGPYLLVLWSEKSKVYHIGGFLDALSYWARFVWEIGLQLDQQRCRERNPVLLPGTLWVRDTDTDSGKNSWTSHSYQEDCTVLWFGICHRHQSTKQELRPPASPIEYLAFRSHLWDSQWK